VDLQGQSSLMPRAICIEDLASASVAIRETLAAGEVVLCTWNAPNMTRFELVLTPLNRVDSHYSEIGHLPGAIGGGFCMVSLDNHHRAGHFELLGRHNELHPDYVAEKLDLVRGSDAYEMARFLNMVGGTPLRLTAAEYRFLIAENLTIAGPR
jgi:hypothetical protein